MAWVIRIDHASGFTTVRRPLRWDVLPPAARERWVREQLELKEPGATYVSWRETKR